jgi:putative heme-binding domain-containing protein
MRCSLRRLVVAALACAWLVGAALAPGVRAQDQGHGYTPQDIENGGLLYQTNCTGCHGPDGDGVPSVNLGGGSFRRGTSDDEIAKIILGGIAGTAMPPNNFSESQAGTIVAYLRSLATAPRSTVARGDATRGRGIFMGKGQCATCHSVAGTGSTVGPVLTEIGTTRRLADLERSLLEPSAEIRTDNRSVRAVRNDGTIVTGRLMNQDTFTVQVLDSTERLRLLQKTDLREVTVLQESPMPSYRDRLTGTELSDLLTYLGSLRGRR